MKARDLRPGDVLVGHAGETQPVLDVLATGVKEVVYNFRVADYHTYFVGDTAWNFSLWAHNYTCNIRQIRDARRMARQMADAGVPGAQRLVRLLNGNARFMSGYVFQARTAHRYWRRGELRALEARVSPGNNRRVDMRLFGGQRVETKSWRNFDYFSQGRRDSMVDRLRSQVNAYLETPNSRLRIEFQSVLPAQVQQSLNALKSIYGERLTWITTR